MIAALLLGAVLSFALFFALGFRVCARGPSQADRYAARVRGQLRSLAIACTISGRAPAMTAACILAVAVFAAFRLPLVVAMSVVAAQLVSQMLVEFAKLRFARTRPDYWLAGREAGHSYPSGHATTAVVFYVGWACVAAAGALPPAARAAAVTILCCWAAGIVWSRLALGAHYLTDVAGGALFGCAWLCGGYAALLHFHAVLR